MRASVRVAAPDDVEWMAELAKRSFDERWHPYMTSTQSGSARYWEVILAFQESFPDRTFLVAETPSGDRLGFADLTRVAPDVAHLSYIAVAESARGRGTGSELLRNYVVRNPDLRTLRLDVFEDNVVARAVYDRLGFEVESVTSWWVVEMNLAAVEPSAGLVLRDLHTAHAWLADYGFCGFDGVLAESRFHFGIMDGTVLRCYDPAVLCLPSVLAGVYQKFPTLSRAFLTVPGTEPPASDVGQPHRIARSMRMVAADLPSRWIR